MQTKLTLRLESHLIISAKQYAEMTDKSLSQVVSDYFEILQHHEAMKKKKKKSVELPPLTRGLVGILKSQSTFDEDDYKKHVEKKYL